MQKINKLILNKYAIKMNHNLAMLNVSRVNHNLAMLNVSGVNYNSTILNESKANYFCNKMNDIKINKNKSVSNNNNIHYVTRFYNKKSKLINKSLVIYPRLNTVLWSLFEILMFLFKYVGFIIFICFVVPFIMVIIAESWSFVWKMMMY